MFGSNRLSKVKGTKKLINRNQLLISLGSPSLDAVIGGGLPVGSILLVEEDEFGIFSEVILKHYLAEGLINDHAIFFGSLDIDWKKISTELPSPLNHDPDGFLAEDKSAGPLRIAWRYENLSFNSTPEENVPVFGNTYDLGTPLKSSVIEKADINHWNGINVEFDDIHGDDYDNLFKYIESILEDEKYEFSAPSDNRTVLRIALALLGTGMWNGNIHKFLIKLRFLLRNSCATCFISVQPKLFEDMKKISRCEHLCDFVIEMKSLLNDGNPAYEDYDGLLVLKKLSNVNNQAPIVPETNDWAFKLKKKRFIVERLHISPELKEHDHREEEDVSNDYSTRKIISSIAQQF